MQTNAGAPPSIITTYVSPRKVSEATGLSETTIWRMRRRGEFPDPVRLSPGRVAWPKAVIEAWLRERQQSTVSDERERNE